MLVLTDWLVDAVVFIAGLLSICGEGRRGDNMIKSGCAGEGGSDCGDGKNKMGEGGAEGVGGGGGEAGIGVGVCIALLPPKPASPEFQNHVHLCSTIVCRKKERKKKEKFTLFSDHNESLLSQKPGAMTIGHSPKGKETS